jgi:hypothetical protein
MLIESATKPCTQCETEYSQSFMGNKCPSCEVVNWKYQEIVIPSCVTIGFIAMLVSLFSLFARI